MERERKANTPLGRNAKNLLSASVLKAGGTLSQEFSRCSSIFQKVKPYFQPNFPVHVG